MKFKAAKTKYKTKKLGLLNYNTVWSFIIPTFCSEWSRHWARCSKLRRYGPVHTIISFMKVCKTSSPCLRVLRCWWRHNKVPCFATVCNTHYVKYGATQILCHYVDPYSYFLDLVDRNSKLTSLPHPSVFLSVLGLFARSVIFDFDITVILE